MKIDKVTQSIIIVNYSKYFLLFYLLNYAYDYNQDLFERCKINE